MKYFLPLFLLFFALNLHQSSASVVTEKNFFASLRAVETNVRAGPSQNYPIKFTFKMRGVPVKVINEYDNWYEIKDYDGDTGWVNQNLLTKKRTIIVKTGKSFVNIFSNSTEKSKNILRVENDVIADFIKCTGPWCAVKASGKKGWIERKEIWGVGESD
jgi:SH3-like domain-containing protein